MNKLYLRYFFIVTLTGIFMQANVASFAQSHASSSDSLKIIKVKITDTRKNKPAYLKNGVKVNFVPFKPEVDKIFGNTSTIPISVKEPEILSDDKILNNVKVYPNPVTDQLNLTYMINKDANVTIKVMDVLGNEIATLYSEHITAGNQNHSFNIASKLSSGFYFVRLVAGNETVVKRISVL